MSSNKIQKKSKKKTLLVAASAVLILLLILFVFEKTNVINLYSKKSQPTTTTEAKTTSTAPSAQENFTDGDERQGSSTNRNEGIVTDTGGNISNTPGQSQWTTSSDGAITVYLPAKSSIIKSGDSMNGTSNLSKVSFRLIDDVSGVIAQGALSVVNGKFSGSFNFSTSGTNGRLDIFNAATDGVESSNVEIPIRFR